MRKGIEAIKRKILEKITPTEKELEKEKEIAEKIIKKIKAVKGIHLEAILAGSLSRNTHLKGERDIDIFILFDKKVKKEKFVKEGLKLAKKISGKNWEIDYGEHPYVKTEIEGYKVELIPAYKIKTTKELISSVDRTPFHTEFVKEKIKGKQRNEVRLLKKFLKGIECYGAELKTQGFSGYLVELLILKYKNFENALKNASQWKDRKVLSMEKIEKGKEKELLKEYLAPLIFLDPTDETRNVSAAVSKESYEKFKEKAETFLKKPLVDFFYPKPVKILKKTDFMKKISKKNLVLIETGYKKIHEDVTFGQLRKFLKKLKVALKKEDFTVLREKLWSDQKKKMLLLVEVKEEKLGKEKLVKGPPAKMKEHGKKFEEKHGKKRIKLIKGQYHAKIKRKHVKAETVVKEFIEKQIKANPKKFLTKRLKKKFSICSGKKLRKAYKEKEVKEFFSKYLERK